MRSKELFIATVIMLSIGCISTQAAPISYSISWSGNNNWSLSGEFSIDDSLLETGPITADSLLSMSFAAFLSGIEQAAFVLDVDNIPSDYNFNFDTTTEQLLEGGLSASTTGQRWNSLGSGAGFGSGGFRQAISINGVYQSNSEIFTTALMVTRDQVSNEIPEPPSILFLGFALLALRSQRTRRERAVRQQEL